eukprot:scaffold33385_cov95-Skeletonema_dohrnii-CCMP3373.AAC.2
MDNSDGNGRETRAGICRGMDLKRIYMDRNTSTHTCRCSTCCCLNACTRDVGSSSTSDGSSQHAGHLCSTTYSSNRLYASERALKSQAYDSKSHSSASEGALESEALDANVKRPSSGLCKPERCSNTSAQFAYITISQRILSLLKSISAELQTTRISKQMFHAKHATRGSPLGR